MCFAECLLVMIYLPLIINRTKMWTFVLMQIISCQKMIVSTV